eukprot:CAMPEP_0117678828 /NCGR_PEP_ID=MMETSP0804-20121206/17502_1 /TAXON_ID=1074897 /ORGANISM="Tetraselmis astigmatica, Strain CCMP880" /LENGTH=56 /DNA_ID=CAMNT_0005488235 /DNA_START=23 /DNA_END=190 /DNA_ORIENTATION=+
MSQGLSQPADTTAVDPEVMEVEAGPVTAACTGRWGGVSSKLWMQRWSTFEWNRALI